MYNNSNLEKKAKYTLEELKKMESALSSIEKYKNMKNEIIKNNSIFGSLFTSFMDDYVNEAEKLLKREYNLNKPIIPKEENKIVKSNLNNFDKKPLKQKEDNNSKNIQINVKKKTEDSFIDKLSEKQQHQIYNLVNEFMNTVICPNIELDSNKYSGLFKGLANYSAWLYQHK